MTKFSSLLMLSTALLISCSHSYPEIPTKRVKMTPFVARGHTPAWWLRLEDTKAQFSANYGQIDIKSPLPVARRTNRGKIYETPRLTVEITYTTCADKMSLERYSEVVTILADGQKYTGCGGMKLPPGSLNGTNWTVLSMNDIKILTDVETHARFDNGYVSIRSNCGKVGGDFAQVENIVTLRRIYTPTNRLCSTNDAAHEAKLLSFLSGRMVVSYSSEGDLILASETGNRMILRRVL